MAGELQKELREVNSSQAPYANDVVLKRCHAAADYIDRLEADKRELVEALEADHKAIDWLFAELIGMDINFHPTKSPVWETAVNSAAMLAKLRGEA